MAGVLLSYFDNHFGRIAVDGFKLLKSFFAFATMPLAALVVLKYLDDGFGGGEFARRLGVSFKDFKLPASFSRAYVNTVFLSDAIFGSKIFSLRALLASAAMTTIWIAVQCGLIVVIDGSAAWVFSDIFVQAIAYQFWGFLILGVGIDFLSVCATRYIIVYALNRTVKTQITILLLELIFSIVLFYLCYQSSKYLFVSSLDKDVEYSSLLQSLNIWTTNLFHVDLVLQAVDDITIIPNSSESFDVQNGNTRVVYAVPEGMLFMSSLLTSLWIWAVVVMQLFLDFLRKIISMKNMLVIQSSIETKPIFSIGLIVTGLVLTPIFSVIWLVMTIFNSQ